MYSVLISTYVLVMDVNSSLPQCSSQYLIVFGYVTNLGIMHAAQYRINCGHSLLRRMLLTWSQTPTWKVARLSATSAILISDMQGYVLTLCVDTRISLMTSSTRISLKLFKEAAKRPLYIIPST